MTHPDLAALDAAEVFRLMTWRVEERTVWLDYGIDDRFTFTEVFELPAPVDGPDAAAAVRLLHLVAGVSYYKLVAPRPIRVETGALSDEERALVAALYDAGMREFAVVNDLPVPLPVEIAIDTPASGHVQAADTARDVPRMQGEGALVPVGGGKDSALVAAVVPDPALLTVNPGPATDLVARRLGHTDAHASVRRRLSPELLRLNAAGARNGHVPITAITAAVAVLVARTNGRRDVVMALERSASEPTRTVGGIPVNHQFSKSLEAEDLLAAAFARHCGVRYFSLLRPLSEFLIAKRCVELGLLGSFLSCNRSFTIERDPDDAQTWCGECPKCAFTFLVFAPHLDPADAAAAFGFNPFERAEGRALLRDLWAVDDKPFECVGERRESAAAAALLATLPAWRSVPGVAELASDAAAALDAPLDEVVADLETPGDHRIPDDYREPLHVLTEGRPVRPGA